MTLSRADQIITKELVEKKGLLRDRMDALLVQAQTENLPLMTVCVRQGVLREEEGLAILAGQMGLEIMDPASFAIAPALLEKVPVKIASYYRFFPVKLVDRLLTVVVSHPLDVKIEDEIRMQLGFDIRMALAREADIARMLKLHYGLGAETITEILSQSPGSSSAVTIDPSHEKIEDIEKQADDASVIKLVNQILLEAYRRRATDIHIEPFRNKVRLRYRIDGVLYDANVPLETRSFLNSILSRIKIMANLNIVEHRLSQDGRAIVKTQDQTLDLRVSFIPTPYGESVVIRILPSKMLFSLTRLGLNGDHLKVFQDFITKPHGIIFVTGPTGSGKTTTLYACLSEINTNARKIITIEDPIEYEMEGITQIQVMPEIGWTFARGLRSMLRHDPDVMMVGEVRDLETAEIAIRVALTGHLVFSTLHTNDAASGITRLMDIGLEPYLVASSVEAFVAQRLIRVLCSGCKKEILAGDDDMILSEMRRQIASDLKLSSVKDVKLYRADGCQACNQTGFFGRTGIYEILPMESFLREFIIKKATSAQIKKFAFSRGMRSLRQDGWLKVIQGVTTWDEVVKVTQAEELPQEVAAASTPRAETVFGERLEEVSNSDNRLYARLHARVNLRYKVFSSLQEVTQRGFKPDQATVTGNVSSGGLLFYTNEPLVVGSFVEIKLELPDVPDTVTCLSKVVRVEEIEVGRKYNIAVQYLDITSAHRARINKFVLE